MSEPKSKNVVLVAFGGPSSSGKTTVAKTLSKLIPKTTLVHLDDFYLTDSKIPVDPTTGYQNWDCADAIDFPKFVDYLKSVRSGHVSAPIESIQSDDIDLSMSPHEIESLVQTIEENKQKISQHHLVFVDGFMLFHDPQCIELFDIRLFFHASFNTLKKRRESRSGYNTAEGFWVDPPNYFEKIVWPAFKQSHKYLFKSEDVEGELKPELAEKYCINDIANETNTTLFDLVNKSLSIILTRT
ncbi:NRK1 [Candida oxycetoniae]|uniref:NRK1 n=1 Tax=Candida oxycetoniae TaxID=497107 RepID=A0AAI9SZC4_9ASCO|nr:NRK1 [Candida oxycetoniae]KAI3405976.2 NRK1 [Candida oxycetoniae]